MKRVSLYAQYYIYILLLTHLFGESNKVGLTELSIIFDTTVGFGVLFYHL